jgi:hypothetical protein
MNQMTDLGEIGREIDRIHDLVEHKVCRCLQWDDDAEAYLTTNEEVVRYRNLRAQYVRFNDSYSDG